MTDPAPADPAPAAPSFFNCGSMSWPCPPRYVPGQTLGLTEAEALNMLMHTALAAKLAPLLAAALPSSEEEVQKLQADVVAWAQAYTPSPRPRRARPSSLALLLAEAEAPPESTEPELWSLALSPRIQALAARGAERQVGLAQSLIAGLL